MPKMFNHRFWYETPMGYMFTDIEAESREDAEREFWLKHHRDTCYVNHVSVSRRYEERDECANEGRDEPLGTVPEPFEPEVMTSCENREAVRDADTVLRPASMDDDARLNLNDERVEHDLVLLVGERDQMKVKKLPKHRFLVNGALQAHVFEPPFEISELAGVLVNLEQVYDQVDGDSFH